MLFNTVLDAASQPAEHSLLSLDLTGKTLGALHRLAGNAWDRSPSGERLEADGQSLLLKGSRVLWAMGEFHYSRYPEGEWRTELLKMKAGGIDVVSTYVFWIHHEEIEGEWNWAGRRDLRRFVSLCGEVGLKVFLRGGPWVHAECRNGGFPDWVVKKYRTRSDDPDYLAQVANFYGKIASQVVGLSWHEGGPVIGFQIENEYGGPSTHLEKLKQIAVAAGIHVPYYSRTGWPKLQDPDSAADLLPMYGGYPIGFWDRGIEETAERYGNQYRISLTRNPDTILQGNDPNADDGPDSDLDKPYLCCEIGGGMAASYHRRVTVSPDDIGSLALAKLASGNNLQGYYMYHGGSNPEGALTWLNETQATGYWNDLPVKTYDFQAPLGEAGQIREHYHILRRLHLFMRDFGADLAGMPTSVPSETDGADALRWSVRSDGDSGFVFVHNYERMKEMPSHSSVQFDLSLSSGRTVLPPMSIPANSYFVWPFNLDLSGVRLRYATAQPICVLRSSEATSYFFAETPGVEAEFALDLSAAKLLSVCGQIDSTTIRVNESGLSPAIELSTDNGHRINIFLLSDEQSLRLWKGDFGGVERVILSSAGIVFDTDGLNVSLESGTSDATISLFPPTESLPIGSREGSFSTLVVEAETRQALQVGFAKIAEAGLVRDIHMGSEGVAEQPIDSDFDQAQRWSLNLPEGADLLPHPCLELRYNGDVARLYLDDKLLSDNFYNGKTYEVNLGQYGPEVFRGHLELRLLPLRADAPIYLAQHAKPSYGPDGTACVLTDASLRGTFEVHLKP